MAYACVCVCVCALWRGGRHNRKDHANVKFVPTIVSKLHIYRYNCTVGDHTRSEVTLANYTQIRLLVKTSKAGEVRCN